MLRYVYMLATVNLKMVREKPSKIIKEIHKFKVSDIVLLRNMHLGVSSKCKFSHLNDRANDLQDPSGHIHCTSVADIQLFLPAEYIVSLLLDEKHSREYIIIIMTPLSCLTCNGCIQNRIPSNN